MKAMSPTCVDVDNPEAPALSVKEWRSAWIMPLRFDYNWKNAFWIATPI